MRVAPEAPYVMLEPFQVASLTMTHARPALIAGTYCARPHFSIVGVSMTALPRSTTPPLALGGPPCPSPAACLEHAIRFVLLPRPPTPCSPWISAVSISPAQVGSSLKL